MVNVNTDRSESDYDSTMSGDSVELQFCLEKYHWETFIEQLEFHFVDKDISVDKKKVSMLMTRVDQDTFKLIKQFTAPDKIIDKTFNDIIKIVNDHFHPKPSVVMERCRFHQAKQEEHESVADFAASLKKLSLEYNFEKLKVSLHD